MEEPYASKRHGLEDVVADEERIEKRAYMKFDKIAKNSTTRMTEKILVKYGYKDAVVRINLMYRMLGFEKYTLKILVMKGTCGTN